MHWFVITGPLVHTKIVNINLGHKGLQIINEQFGYSFFLYSGMWSKAWWDKWRRYGLMNVWNDLVVVWNGMYTCRDTEMCHDDEHGRKRV